MSSPVTPSRRDALPGRPAAVPGAGSARAALPFKPVARRHHILFAAATVLYWMTMYVYVPILTPFLQDRGLSMGWIGFIVGSYGLSQMLIRFPLGVYSDRMSRRKPFLIAGMLAGLVGSALFLVGDAWQGPLAGRLVLGICASSWVAYSVLYASYYPPEQSTKAMSTISFLTVVGQLAGMTASGWLASAGGWETAFLTGIGLAAAGMLAAACVFEPPSPSRAALPAAAAEAQTAAPGGARRSVRKNVTSSPLLIEVSLLSLLVHCILFITMFGFTPLQAVALGASEVELTWLVVAFMVPHALVSLWSGRLLAPRFGERNVIIAGFILSAACSAAIPLCASLPSLLATQAVNGAAQAMVIPLLLGLAIRDYPSSERATAMGFYQSVYSIGMFAGPYVAGWFNNAGGLRAGFWFAGAIGLAAAAIALIGAKRRR
ncbi:MFS transporter [Cohnella algarum]|uniref:MFS transporter n=1 Tax=Cohnella algarum TaxID=2044859 RepID=UPI001967E1A2|nr:MFS transporter [Cohnella algarum]MBN2984226.1 MFS transporter [Cohnella algarum]